jgi:hypothetical protein
MKTFAFPNLKDGSIIEYRYKNASPYHFALEDWQFQSQYPKVYSELHAKINSNYNYRKILIGNLKLDIENSSWQKRCLYVEGLANAADCEIIHLGMKDIPAFIEEDFMLSSKNYASRVSFNLIYYINLLGIKTFYTKPWKDFDDDFEKSIIHKHLNQKVFFKNKIPKEIATIKDPIEKAKKVFSFFQKQFTWNDYLFRSGQNIDLRGAFNNQIGSVDEINLSLLNSLLGLGFKAHIMLAATRDKGLPSDIHPTFYDYDYILVRLEIDNKIYLLDATDKFTSFGLLPFRVLNHHGRVFNYNGVSFWQDTRVFQTSNHQITVLAKLNPNGTLNSKVNERHTDYFARNKREIISNKNITDYKLEKEKSFHNNIISNLNIYNQKDNEAAFVERFETESTTSKIGDKIILNPFLYSFFDNNPLTLNERSYPLNFGYPKHYVYQTTIELAKNYEVLEIPKNNSFFSIDNSIEVKFSANLIDNKIDILFELKISGVEYPSESYQEIKDLFSQSINLQKNSLIILRKK